MTFTDNGDGTATLPAHPQQAQAAATRSRSPPRNSAGHTNQSFTLTVNRAAGDHERRSRHVHVGSAGSFTVTTTAGYPAATTISESGILPGGVTLTDNHERNRDA